MTPGDAAIETRDVPMTQPTERAVRSVTSPERVIYVARDLWRAARRGTPAWARMTFLSRTRDVFQPSAFRVEARVATFTGLAVYLLPALGLVLGAAAAAAAPGDAEHPGAAIVGGVCIGFFLGILQCFVIQAAMEVPDPQRSAWRHRLRLRRPAGTLDQATTRARADDLATFLLFAARARGATSHQARRLLATHDAAVAAGAGLEIGVRPYKPDPLWPLGFEIFFDESPTCPSPAFGGVEWRPVLAPDFADPALLRGIEACLAGPEGASGLLRWPTTVFARLPSVEDPGGDPDRDIAGDRGPRFCPEETWAFGVARDATLSAHTRRRFMRWAARDPA